MTRRATIFHSLSAQLLTGMTLLLGLTVVVVSYVLIRHEQSVLAAELEKTVVAQGRSIAFSSLKPLLRNDPGLELHPIVTRTLEDVARIESIVIVDADGIIRGHTDPELISKPFDPGANNISGIASDLLEAHERLVEHDKVYRFETPVKNADEHVGTVYLAYSKTDLLAAKREAFGLTLKLSAGVLVLGVLFLLPLLRRISRSMATSAHEQSIPRELMDRELGIAADIQQSFIPAAVTAPKGYEIAYHYQAAHEVGGDYIDVIPLEDGRVAFVMADVAGRGVPGLVVMAMVKVITHHLILSAGAPSTIIRRINEALIGNMKRNMFVTMFVAILDCDNGRVSVSNAGHNPLIVYTHETDEARVLKMDGLPLGTFPPQIFDTTVRDYQIELGPGDVLLQYTDGLNESRAEGGHIFGIDRIRDAADLYGSYGAERIVEKLVAEEQHFRGGSAQSDDITLLAVGSAAKTTSRLKEPVA